MTAGFALMLLGLVFVVVAGIAIALCNAICPREFWTTPPHRRVPVPPPPRPRPSGENVIDLAEWRPRYWR